MMKTVIFVLGLMFAISLCVPLASNAQPTRLSDDQFTASDEDEDTPPDVDEGKEKKDKKKGKKGKKGKKDKKQDNKK